MMPLIAPAPMVSPQTMYFCTIRLCTSCGTAATIVAAFLGEKANGPGVGAGNAGDERQRHRADEAARALTRKPNRS